MNAKKIITFIFGSLICMNTVSPVPVHAEIHNPEVIQTEVWYAYCYVDNKTDELYPCIRCEANILDDGSLKLYLKNVMTWNTDNNSHTLTLCNPTSVSTATRPYAFYMGNPYVYDDVYYVACSKDDFDKYLGKNPTGLPTVTNPYRDYDICFYPDSYEWSGISITDVRKDGTEWGTEWYRSYYMFMRKSSAVWGTSYSVGDIERHIYRGNLNHIKEGYICDVQTFTPKTTLTKDAVFRLYGKEITISAEFTSLRQNLPDTDKDAYIKELETRVAELENANTVLAQKNHELENRINLLTSGDKNDINGDCVVDIEDVQYLLMWYTETKVAKKSNDSVDTWYVNRFGDELR